MEKKDAHELLLALDASYPLGEEVPANFAYEGEMKRVRRVHKLIEDAIGLRLRLLTSSAQESYFFAEIVSPAEKPFDSELLLSIRFSSFGHLVSGWSRMSNSPGTVNVLGSVQQVLEEEGYTFIEFDRLSHFEYDGHHPVHAQPSFTWWDRFFGYT